MHARRPVEGGCPSTTLSSPYSGAGTEAVDYPGELLRAQMGNFETHLKSVVDDVVSMDRTKAETLQPHSCEVDAAIYFTRVRHRFPSHAWIAG